MKSMIQRSLSFLLSVALLATPCALASDVFGDKVAEKHVQLHEGTEYVQTVFWQDSGLREENYAVYIPNYQVIPTLFFGDSVLDLRSVTTGATRIEANGDQRAMVGINGDYFGVSTGMPLGCTMTDGVLRNASNEHYAVGFRPDGSAIFGAPLLDMEIDVLHAPAEDGAEMTEDETDELVPKEEMPVEEEEMPVEEEIPQDASAQETPAEEVPAEEAPRYDTFSVTGYNFVRNSAGGIYLFNQDFSTSHKLGVTEPGVNVICRAVDGRPSIGETLTLLVEEVQIDALDTQVEDGYYVLSANNNAGETFTAPLRSLQAGDTLTLSVTAADPAWNDVVTMIGALYPLIVNGEVQSDLETARAPRTALGLREDGAVILYTIDGRQNNVSVGAGLSHVASRLKELGCVEALALDGGGSTTFLATLPTGDGAAVLNHPSDGAPNRVTNSLFLVAPTAPTGTLHSVAVAAEKDVILTGMSVALRTAVLDTNYLPGLKLRVALSADAGSIENDLLTTPETPCTLTVTAQCEDKTAQTKITVIAAPDELLCKRDGNTVETLTLGIDEEVTLTAQAKYQHRLLIDPPITWRFDGNGATVENGVLRSGAFRGSGTLYLQCGTAETAIPVEVIPAIEEGADAAPVISLWLSDDGMTLCGSVIDEIDGTNLPSPDVRLDDTAIAFDYDSETGALTAPLDVADGTYHHAAVIACDGSGNYARAGLDVIPNGEAEAPFADMVGHWASPYVARLKLDGISNGNGDGTYAPDRAVSRQEFATLLYRFLSPEETYTDVELPFADTDAIADWAMEGVQAMVALGIVKGSEDDGVLYFHPQSQITRQEAAVMLSRCLTQSYALGQEVFADADAIADWASDAVAVLVATGVLTGFEDGGFHPLDPLTRAQTAAVLCRMR